MKFRIDTRGMELDLSLTGDPLDQDSLANDYEKETQRATAVIGMQIRKHEIQKILEILYYSHSLDMIQQDIH